MRKTVSSVFHLNNRQAGRGLQVKLGIDTLSHDPHSKYQGVTLDRTLSYKTQCTSTAAKINTRNNLLRKISYKAWGADHATLKITALSLCYSVAEYCIPAWGHSKHIGKVDVALRNTMRAVAGSLKLTPITMLPPLSGLPHPETRRSRLTEDFVAKYGLARRQSNRIKRYDMLCPVQEPTMPYISPLECFGFENGHLPFPDLERALRVRLNRVVSNTGMCAATKKRFGVSQSDVCECGAIQTMNHLIDECDVYGFHGDLRTACCERDDAVIPWLRSLPDI
jgi:hypothetical protein